MPNTVEIVMAVAVIIGLSYVGLAHIWFYLKR